MPLTAMEKATPADYRAIFLDTDAGKKVLDDLSGYCYENRNTFAEGRPDIANKNCGKRAVILYIRSRLETVTAEKQDSAKNEMDF
jgi:hypothetical protein